MRELPASIVSGQFKKALSSCRNAFRFVRPSADYSHAIETSSAETRAFPADNWQLTTDNCSSGIADFRCGGVCFPDNGV